MTYIFFIVEIILLLLFIYSRDKDKRVENVCMIIACILWTLIYGLRANCVGNDTLNYAFFYENRNIPGVGYGTVDIPGDQMEIGFIIISRILHCISDSTTFFFTVIAVCFFSCIYFLYRYGCHSNMIWCFLLLNITGNTFICTMSMLRQTMSICVLFIALVFFFNLYSRNQGKLNFKKNYKNINFLLFVGLSFFSILVHRTSLMIFAVIFILSFIKNSKTISTIAIVVAFICAFFYAEVPGLIMDMALGSIDEFSDEKISLLGNRYEHTMSQTEGMSVIRALSYCVPILVTIKYSEEKDVKSIFFKCMITAFVCQLMFSTSYMMNRLSVVFIVLGMCKFVPASAMTKGSKLFYFYILVTIYYLWRAFVAYGKWPITDSTLPYYFFWQQ